MAWTSPRTWVAAEIVTAALMNAHVRDNLSFLSSPPRCQATASSVATIATATTTLVAFDAETYDSNTMHDNVTNNSRIVFTTGGTYRVTARTTWTANAAGVRAMDVRKNAAGASGGGTRLQYSGVSIVGGGDLATVEMTFTAVFAAADYLEVFRVQTSGGALAPSSAGLYNMVEVCLIAAA